MQRSNRTVTRVALWGMALALLALGVAGCSGTAVELGKVEGTITLDGQPLADADVAFRPKEGGRTAIAVTDSSGHYVLEFAAGEQGALVGPHLVRVTTFVEEVTADDGSVEEEGREELVPAKYNEESELEVDVTGGAQTFDFALESQ